MCAPDGKVRVYTMRYRVWMVRFSLLLTEYISMASIFFFFFCCSGFIRKTADAGEYLIRSNQEPACQPRQDRRLGCQMRTHGHRAGND